MGHVAGFGHPNFKGMTFKSECKPPGSTLCPGHCIEWIGACETHISFGSERCGSTGLGCQARCVKAEYCNSLPERITECFGYQKVHSRGETLGDKTSGLTGTAGEVAGKTAEVAGKG